MMNQMNQADIIQLGRIIGLIVIGLGIILALWNAVDADGLSGSETFRFFLSDALTWLAWGSFVYLAAEIADRVGVRRP
jgi:hypothetical protein